MKLKSKVVGLLKKVIYKVADMLESVVIDDSKPPPDMDADVHEAVDRIKHSYAERRTADLEQRESSPPLFAHGRCPHCGTGFIEEQEIVIQDEPGTAAGWKCIGLPTREQVKEAFKGRERWATGVDSMPSCGWMGLESERGKTWS